MSVTLSTTYPAARKKHRCEWCGEFILVGEEHYKWAGVFEGDFQSWRAHLECLHMMDYLHKNGNELCEDGFEPYYHRRGRTYEQRVAARLQGAEDWQY